MSASGASTRSVATGGGAASPAPSPSLSLSSLVISVTPSPAPLPLSAAAGGTSLSRVSFGVVLWSGFWGEDEPRVTREIAARREALAPHERQTIRCALGVLRGVALRDDATQCLKEALVAAMIELGLGRWV